MGEILKVETVETTKGVTTISCEGKPKNHQVGVSFFRKATLREIENHLMDIERAKLLEKIEKFSPPKLATAYEGFNVKSANKNKLFKF
jgi:hypothetical protein